MIYVWIQSSSLTLSFCFVWWVLLWWNRFLCSPGWPQTYYVAEEGLELLILWLPPLECWDSRCVARSQGFQMCDRVPASPCLHFSVAISGYNIIWYMDYILKLFNNDLRIWFFFRKEYWLSIIFSRYHLTHLYHCDHYPSTLCVCVFTLGKQSIRFFFLVYLLFVELPV